MTNYYTRSGDDGYTGVLGEGRVPKYHPRTEAVGAIDEANAALGLARALCLTDTNKTILLTIQRELYQVMAEAAATVETAARFRTIGSAHVTWLEEQTDRLAESLEMPNEFIVPGDSLAGAALALARTTVRRAERWLAQLTHLGEIENPQILRYVNRLSSLCFVMELVENKASGSSTTTLAKQ